MYDPIVWGRTRFQTFFEILIIVSVGMGPIFTETEIKNSKKEENEFFLSPLHCTAHKR